VIKKLVRDLKCQAKFEDRNRVRSTNDLAEGSTLA